MSHDLCGADRWARTAALRAPSPMLQLRRVRFQAAAKRCLDVVGAILLLVLVAPAFLLATLVVRIDGGPIFYSHRRVGRFGRSFGCLKFRTMRTDADAALARLFDEDYEAKAEWEATRKLRSDPRVTRAGRLLRATSLDELPQLINVLRGEMSLVGPRPVVQAELDQHYGPAASADYMRVRPGITGPWQVSGRSTTAYSERVELDRAYATAQPSLLRDLHILFRTVGAVVRRQGAY